ncbi:E3 SUMO-protein ligase ZNF451 isoform X2 [Hyperolius riggenbachi]|uniref:E3 SUMO-protein ligase ZNF451 isoform X2 n=1 Tax=Hyperolius riggenbachi TaxID=752182 RepID=UPI0035A26E58
MMDTEMLANEYDTAAKEETEDGDHCSENEIEFVREGQLRPVLECIDLVSSDDETQILNLNRKPKDHVDYQKERVASTLDRLARHVAEEKQQRAEKNKAFQEKLNFQHAHGLQELEFIKDRPGASAAKICVSEWLKMPGLKPGSVCSSRRNFSQPRQLDSINSRKITCPIMHCNREYENGQLLLGHLKRFDHSPCDPTIYLQGEGENLCACLLCSQRFSTMKEYRAHMSAKAELADGHEQSLSPLVIQCFACPSCFLLFNQRDECLKHMSATNHFTRKINIDGQKGIACPVPMPSYAKRVLIALCKDIPFQVICTSCRCELRSHIEVTAHFRTRCRNAGPTVLSDKSIAEVASVFLLKAFCQFCKRSLSTDAQVAQHIEKKKHKVKHIASIEESVLAFCYLNDGRKRLSDFCMSAANARLKPCILKRTLNESYDISNILLKCKKENENDNINDCPIKKESDLAVTAWFCECSQQFVNENAAEKHIMIANRISHRCLVCGKTASDSGIIHLHMSRFHGGAHLNNFCFWCEICRIKITRTESMMTHIVDCHGGHSFYYEQEVPQEPTSSSQAESLRFTENPTPPSVEPAQGLWQCHICEEMFDTEETIQEHCKSLTVHQFYKYCCDTCKKKFHKMETLLRHCQLQHDSNIMVKYFCGLCEDLFYDEEKDFLTHYESFHSRDYGFVPNQCQSPTKTQEMSSTSSGNNQQTLTCGCLALYEDKARRLVERQLCLDKLLETGKLWFSCCLCQATDQSLNGIRAHNCKKGGLLSDKNVVIKCSTCSKSFINTDGAQSHYHAKHCFLEKPSKEYTFVSDQSKDEVFRFHASGTRVMKKSARPKHTHGSQLHDVAQGSNPNAVTASLSRCQSEPEPMEIQPADTETQEDELPDLDFLRTMTHIVFIDLDNWTQFFTHLPGYLNQGTFVWGFQGGKNSWKPPVNCKFFKHLSNTGCFFLHPRCTDRKDAADFAICIHAGRLDEQLPKQIPFTVLSGDKGFLELENQFKKTQRPAHILNPHHVGGDVMCALLNSISDTTQDADIKEAIRRSLLEK